MQSSTLPPAPFNADADHPNVGWRCRLLGRTAAPFDAGLNARLKAEPPVPTPSIDSRSDGIVAWQTCLHGSCAVRDVHGIEIHGGRIGMSWNSEALAIVDDRLAFEPAKWHPYPVAIGAA